MQGRSTEWRRSAAGGESWHDDRRRAAFEGTQSDRLRRETQKKKKEKERTADGPSESRIGLPLTRGKNRKRTLAVSGGVHLGCACLS